MPGIVTQSNEPLTHRAVVASIKEYTVPGTSEVTLLTFTPAADDIFTVNVYYRVVTGATNVTINVQYTDGTGAQTYSIQPLASKAVGEYSFPPVNIFAKTTAAINVKVTAGTANQLVFSGEIIG
jgi:hypothetical protein